MTEYLKEIDLNVGHRRVGRLVRQNGISVRVSSCVEDIAAGRHNLRDPSERE
ncbi:transposase [Pseudosulfitobacter pseudonitzschiae]|uniref:Transposase n=1 Tax=Pseudosulfitobacter pseudonitzschiae TaxID=1402135 RepID=A0A221JWA8_9RHOB|nr:transposase [Pseudosulfitobacter pseudonitzschiae]